MSEEAIGQQNRVVSVGLDRTTIPRETRTVMQESQQPKLFKQVEELERQLLMHSELVRDKHQQINTLMSELVHVRREIEKCLGVEFKNAKDAVAAAVKEIVSDGDSIERLNRDFAEVVIENGKVKDCLDRIPLFIRRIWGAV